MKFKMIGNGSGIEEVSESSCLCASVLKKDAGVVEGDFSTETQRRRGTEFKMTEIGLIPEDWEVKRLGDVCEINPRVEGEIPDQFIYVDLESVVDGALIVKKKLLRAESPSRAQRRFRRGDVLFQTVRPYQRNNLLVDFDAEDYVASTGYAIIREIELLCVSEFIYHIVHMDNFVNDVMDRCTGTSYPAINPRKLAEIMICIPKNISEQKAIAEVLSDVDELLAAMTTLIEKKRAIKQGAMQELLTGKKRLVGFKNSESSCLCASVLKKDAGTVEGGFNTKTQRRRGTEFKMTEIGLIPEDWDVKRIGDIGQVVTGSTPPRNNSANWGGDFNWISAKDFNGKYISKTEEHITEAGKRFCRLLPENSVLVTCIASIGLNAISKKACATNQQINAVVCRVDSPEYLYYQICYRNGDLKLLAGQTAVLIIGKKQFEDVLIPVPPLPEQKKIAEVLSDMDAEIEALEAKRAKYESIKQGMMQELLTGKTRLV